MAELAENMNIVDRDVEEGSQDEKTVAKETTTQADHNVEEDYQKGETAAKETTTHQPDHSKIVTTYHTRVVPVRDINGNVLEYREIQVKGSPTLYYVDEFGFTRRELDP